MDNGTQTRMTLLRVPLGGFVVQSESPFAGALSEPTFAATTIDEALNFMRAAMKPIGPENPPDGTNGAH